MYRYGRVIGFALVLCLAVAAFGIVADDSDSSDADYPYAYKFSERMNEYNELLLGTGQTVVSSAYSSSTLTVTVNTASSNIETISLDLNKPFEELMQKLEEAEVQTLTIKNTNVSPAVSYNVITQSGGKTVINHGASFDFIMSVLEVMRNENTSGSATYNGNIIINGESDTLKIIINLDSTLKGLMETLSGLKLINVEVSQGKVSKITITNNAIAADILGKPSASEFQAKTLIEIISSFAADGVLAKIVNDSTQQQYLNKVCGKVVDANKLDEFLDSVFSVEVNSITMEFGKPTVSSSKNFKGLMETVKDAMSKGTNYDKKISDISDYNSTTGIISIKPITVTWKSGTSEGATGTAVTIDKTDVVFGITTLNTLVSPNEGGTITFESSATNNTSNKFVSWSTVTIKSTAATGYTLDSVSYRIGSGDYVALQKSASQEFIVPGTGASTDVTIKATFTKNSPVPPGPGPTPTTKYTVTFNATNGGKVSPTSISVSAGTSYSASANVLKFGSSSIFSTEVTATPDEGYIFKSWSSISGKVNSNMTITATFEKSGPVAPIEKVVENGSIYLPGDVVQALGITDPSKLILTIKITKTVPSNVPEDAVCYQVTLTYDGKEIKTFNDYVTIGLKYTVPAGADVKNIKVYWVSDDGYTVEEMKATYDSDKGLMKFDIPHLSVFAITQKEIEPIHGKLVSISVKTAPSKLSYIEGEMFNPAGLVITLTYDHGNPSTLEYKGNESQFGFTPSLTTPLKTSDKAVAITYDGKTTTQAITVSAEPEPTPSGGDNTVLYIVIAIIVIIVVIAIVFFFLKKKGI